MWDPHAGREVGPRIATVGGFSARRAEVGEPIESPGSPITSAAFSPDGTLLATGTGAGVVQQWSTSTHLPLGPALKGHTGPVAGIAYSRDGRLLAATTVGFSRSRLWDTATGAPVGQELVGGRTPFTFATFDLQHFQGSRPAFAPDGRSLAVPSFDGTTAVWDLEPAHWLAAACQLAGRNLTAEEWDQYMGRLPYRARCP